MIGAIHRHYVVTGPEDTPYEGGFYHGKLIFPSEYPFRPPRIIMITPNGRFQTNTRLCLSISDYHPDSWNPAWSVSTILTGLLSFMVETAPTLGSVETSTAQKRMYAIQSWSFNLNDSLFVKLFPDIVKRIEEKVAERRRLEEEERCQNTSDVDLSGEVYTAHELQHGIATGFFSNLMLILGVFAFAYTVKALLQSLS